MRSQHLAWGDRSASTRASGWTPKPWRSAAAAHSPRLYSAALSRCSHTVGGGGALTKAVQCCAVQMFALCRGQGRLAELVSPVMDLAAQDTALPIWRCALAVLHSELSDRKAAQQEFERLAVRDFSDLPHDMYWLPALALLAEVACFLGDRQRAMILYALLQPYAAHNIVVATAAASYGSVAHYLGLLATMLSRWDDAEQHFTAAMAMNTRMRTHPCTASTQYAYARMLLDRGYTGDCKRMLTLLDEASNSAHAMGLTRLWAQIEALREHSAEEKEDRIAPLALTAQVRVCHRNGTRWSLSLAGQTVLQRDVKGWHYMAYLLQHPGQEVHVLDLLALTDAHPVTPATTTVAALSAEALAAQHMHVSSRLSDRTLPDAQARAAYRHRLHALHEELHEAKDCNDPFRATQAQAEIDCIASELAPVYGYGVRTRASNDAVEKARKAVTNRIRGALAKLQPVHPALWQHLFASLKTGTYCVYSPAQPTPWTF